MIFRLLGSLTIQTGGGPVVLRGNRSRAVLALLLLHADLVVQTDHIVDAVWGDKPPPTVRTQVQSQICEIRRQLTGVGGLRIETFLPGYRLTIDPAELDLHAVRTSVLGARVLIAEGDRPRAAAALRSAAALYRGPALSDVDAPFVRATAYRLEDERLSLLEELIDLDLSMGRHHEAVVRLNELVDEHPLREGLWWRLIQALQNADRRGDAFQAYRRACHILSVELGVGPGERLSAAYDNLVADRDHAPTRPMIDMADTLRRLEEAECLLREIRRRLPSADHLSLRRCHS